MSQRQIRYTAFADLHAIKRRLSADVYVRSADRAALIKIIEDIAADRDVREKFWRTERGAPRKDTKKKFNALIEVEKLKKQMSVARAIETAAKRAGLTLDAVTHEYKRLHPRKQSAVKGVN